MPVQYYPDILCACGCEGRIPIRPWHVWYGVPFFLYTHQNRCEHSRKLQSIAKQGDKNPMFDVHRYGKDAPGWQGGISFAPYGVEFNNKLREQIRKRDRDKCRQCGVSQKKLGYRLHVHHIDYNKRNNLPTNLISLCLTCHMQTNYKRKDWTKYFQEMQEQGDTYVDEKIQEESKGRSGRRFFWRDVIPRRNGG